VQHIAALELDQHLSQELVDLKVRVLVLRCDATSDQVRQAVLVRDKLISLIVAGTDNIGDSLLYQNNITIELEVEVQHQAQQQLDINIVDLLDLRLNSTFAAIQAK
jgi:hypothetical protein